MRRITTLMGLVASALLSAQNPFVQTRFTTDPAPMVKGDTLYVYSGVDEPGADFFWMYQWRVYSTTDMANWTDHGELLGLDSFSWADDRAWASQCVERNGKYYWYVCAHSKLTGGMAIGVAVADTPTGPFRDALGKPLYDDGEWDNIDPTVLVDGDKAYIVWGNPEIHQARLGADMVSLDSFVTLIEQTERSFGAPSPKQRVKGTQYKDMYTEGPWLSRRGNHYYLLYAAGGVPEHIAYSMSSKPTGPWTYKGIVMPQLNATGSFTNHCGLATFRGRDYFFYHTGNLPGGGGFGRSMAVEAFSYNADGTLPTIMPTRRGVAPIAPFDPYRRVEAETIAWSEGLTTEQNDRTGVYVSDIHHGDWLKVAHVDFGTAGPRRLTVHAASGSQGGTIVVSTDSLGATPIAELQVPRTGGWEAWRTLTVDVSHAPTGTHDLYFAFKGQKGRKLMNLDAWRFE